MSSMGKKKKKIDALDVSAETPDKGGWLRLTSAISGTTDNTLSLTQALYAMKRSQQWPPDLQHCRPEFFSAFKAQANECAAMTKTNAVADI